VSWDWGRFPRDQETRFPIAEVKRSKVLLQRNCFFLINYKSIISILIAVEFYYFYIYYFSFFTYYSAIGCFASFLSFSFVWCEQVMFTFKWGRLWWRQRLIFLFFSYRDKSASPKLDWVLSPFFSHSFLFLSYERDLQSRDVLVSFLSVVWYIFLCCGCICHFPLLFPMIIVSATLIG